MDARERDGGPRPLGPSLDEVSKKLGVDDARGLGRLFAHWEEIVGPALAEHVQPLRVDRDRLVVSVDHPAWATQVRHLSAELLDRVTREAGLPRPACVEVRIRR
jgi:predicted nucleic acid-binding Zn ribbon protein